MSDGGYIVFDGVSELKEVDEAIKLAQQLAITCNSTQRVFRLVATVRPYMTTDVERVEADPCGGACACKSNPAPAAMPAPDFPHAVDAGDGMVWGLLPVGAVKIHGDQIRIGKQWVESIAIGSKVNDTLFRRRIPRPAPIPSQVPQ